MFFYGTKDYIDLFSLPRACRLFENKTVVYNSFSYNNMYMYRYNFYTAELGMSV